LNTKKQPSVQTGVDRHTLAFLYLLSMSSNTI